MDSLHAESVFQLLGNSLVYIYAQKVIPKELGKISLPKHCKYVQFLCDLLHFTIGEIQNLRTAF